jgi:hypothetical protein
MEVLYWITRLLLAAALFLLPGAAIALLLSRHTTQDKLRFLCTSLTGSALIAYAGFLVYWWNRGAGKALAILIPALALGIVLRKAAWLRRNHPAVVIEYRNWIAAALLAAAFYTFAGGVYLYSPDLIYNAQGRFLIGGGMPPDNVLPLIVADRIYRGEELRPYLIPGWKSSDRPPAQSGAILMQLPWSSETGRSIQYQLLGTFLQSLWIAALGVLLRRAGVHTPVIAAVLWMCVFSNFFFFNSYYVWPKLYAAALLLIGLSCTPLVGDTKRGWNSFDTILAAAAIALAMLSHAGVAFTLIAVVLVAPFVCRPPALRIAIPAVAVFVMLSLPWTMYQKYYDPPGNRLLKMHLAGVFEETDNRSFGQALLDSYSKLSWAEFAHSKVENFKVLFWSKVLHGSSFRQMTHYLLIVIFFSIFPSAGLLCLGFAPRIYESVRKRRLLLEATRDADRWLLICGISLVIWCVMLFAPGTTSMHAGSYANVMLLFAALAVYLANFLPRWAMAGLGTLQLVYFVAYVLVTPMLDMYSGEPRTGVWSIAAAVASVLTLALISGAALRYPQFAEAPSAVPQRKGIKGSAGRITHGKRP